MDHSAPTGEDIIGSKRCRKESTIADVAGSSMKSGQTPILSQKGKSSRGPTCMQVMATTPRDRKLVEWNDKGQPVGDVSVKFSSTMGVLVREQVPIIIDTWHKVDDPKKENLWGLITKKYLVDVCFKPFVLQQMGRLWRTWKSELSSSIRKILESRSTKTERTNRIGKLRPHWVSLAEWDQFVHQRMIEAWMAKSEKMREIRSKLETSHTMSRQGYARMAHKHNQSNPDNPLGKADLWFEAHTSKTKTIAANVAKIDEIKKKMSELPPTDDGSNVLTEVLGKDCPGRMRCEGSGVTKSKLNALSLKDLKYAQMEARFNKMASENKKMRARNKKVEDFLVSKLGLTLDEEEEDDEDDNENVADVPIMCKAKVQCDARSDAREKTQKTTNPTNSTDQVLFWTDSGTRGTT